MRIRFPRFRNPLPAIAAPVLFLVSMFEEKRETDGIRRLSMLRCTIAAFAAALTRRIWMMPTEPGWPLAFMWVSTLVALPLTKALESVPPAKVLEFFTSLGGSLSQGKTVATAVATINETVQPTIEPEGQ